MSRHFEDFEIGFEVISRGRTITEADIVNFAGISGDFIELHTNAAMAAQSPFGQRNAHGALIFSISTGLMTQMDLISGTVLAFYGVDRLRFTKPVFIGDTVHVHKKVAAKQAKGLDRGLVTFETAVVNQHGDAVLLYTDKLLIKARGGT